MRHCITAWLGLLAASTAAARDSGAPQTLYYTVSNLFVHWSLGHIIETSFDVKEKDTNKDIAHCAGKAPFAVTPPPKDQPFDVGHCEDKDHFSSVTAIVGGSPGQNLLLYLNNTQSIPCGPEKRYEGMISFTGQYFTCNALSENGNSAECHQKPGVTIELPLNKYFEGKPEKLHRRDAQAAGC